MRPLQPGLSLRTYRLESLLGFGASGQVWLARNPQGAPVALKARPRADGDEQRFRQEFEKLRTLRVPGVVRVLDAGADQGYLFFTMDVATGVRFDQRVQQGATLAERVRRTVAAGRQVARALGAIHRMGLAHRDIKPANVLVDAQGRTTVLDFGTARFDANPGGTTSPSGTAAYMAPEQRIGLPSDARVDVYALGVMLHEALSGTAPGTARVGRPRPSLARLGVAVPLPLAWLVDQMLLLDRHARPGAAEVEALLAALDDEACLPPVPWPSPSTFCGDPTPLLETSVVVCGPPGSGRTRLVEEARWHWFRRGYRSLAGQCGPSRPYGALRDLLEAFFAGTDPAERAALAGEDAALLMGIWPQLPVEVDEPAAVPVPPRDAAQALCRLFALGGPLALVLWDLEDADVGTEAIVRHMVPRLPSELRVWATASSGHSLLPSRKPEPWRASDHAAVCRDLLPDHIALPSACPTPLESVVAAWRQLATWRGERGPSVDPDPTLDRLTVLDAPFPRRVAEALVGAEPVDRALAGGDLVRLGPEARAGAPGSRSEGSEETTETQAVVLRASRSTTKASVQDRELLAFGDHGTWLLSRQRRSGAGEAHAAAVSAWAAAPSRDAPLRSLEHAMRARTATADQLRSAVLLHLERGEPGAVAHWLRLRRLLFGPSDDFLLRYAELYVLAELHPGRLGRDRIRALGREAETPEERGRAGFLLLMHDARYRDREEAIGRGRAWASTLRSSQPLLAASLLREVALAQLAAGRPSLAVADCQAALALAGSAAPREPQAPPCSDITHAEASIATTLSAGLVYDGRLHEAASLCESTASRCAEAGLDRGEAALLANASLAHLHLGDRRKASEMAARCRRLQPRHRDPIVAAVAATLRARLAVELGDPVSARPLLAEAMTAAQALSHARLLAEQWCLVLDLSVQTLEAFEARRALSSYTEPARGSRQDHWPAALARWLWLRGDLDKALRATESQRAGHGSFLVRAERSRLLLLSRDVSAAARTADRLASDAHARGMKEIACFADLVSAAARGSAAADVEPLLRQTRESRWVHLYLGALHLDAIRRQNRGEHIGPQLRLLRARATDVGHALYAALAREAGW